MHPSSKYKAPTRVFAIRIPLDKWDATVKKIRALLAELEK
jgi:hypothetical protein